MIYSDVTMCSLSFRKRDLHFARITSISNENFSMFTIYLYFRISIISILRFRVRSLDFGYNHQSLSTNCKFLIIYFCFLDIDDCDPLPCENGATCTDAGVNNYTCTCMAGYEGYNCSIGNLDHLFSIPPISREESYIVLSLILILPLTRHPMIYNDVRM